MLPPCAGLALLGPIDEKFVEVVDVMEALESGSGDRAFISRGYDATSHFETTVRSAADPAACQFCQFGFTCGGCAVFGLFRPCVFRPGRECGSVSKLT